jgi:hypothetical protein
MKEERVLEYQKDPSFCGQCGIQLCYEKRKYKFCSKSCSAKVNNLGVRRHGIDPGKCKICDRVLKSHQNKCCSYKCSSKYRSQLNVSLWLSGKKNGLKGDQVSSYVIRYLRNINDDKCQECGWSELNTYTNTKPLTVHHIDGNWRNNKIENLKLLCPNCHSLTRNYGGRNRGKGRPARQKWRKKNRG